MRAPDHRRARTAAGRQAGFTLIEMMIVVAIIGIIAGIAVAQLRTTPIKAKEAVLKEDLFALRDVIDQYFADKGKYPDSLQTLVDDGYIRKIPVDPFTKTSDSWQSDQAGATEGESDPSGEVGGGVIDVHSGADGTALDGTRYKDW